MRKFYLSRQIDSQRFKLRVTYNLPTLKKNHTSHLQPVKMTACTDHCKELIPSDNNSCTVYVISYMHNSVLGNLGTNLIIDTLNKQ